MPDPTVHPRALPERSRRRRPPDPTAARRRTRSPSTRAGGLALSVVRRRRRRRAGDRPSLRARARRPASSSSPAETSRSPTTTAAAGRLPGRESVFDDLPSAIWLPDGRRLVDRDRPAAGRPIDRPSSWPGRRAPERDGVATEPDRDPSRRTSWSRPAAPATPPARSATSSRRRSRPIASRSSRSTRRRATGRAGRRTSTTSTTCRAKPCSRRSTTTGSAGPTAWALQRVYRADRSRDAIFEVRDGEVVLVTDGYHPFAAAHGDDAYYLNALAGDRRTMACSFDPDLDWVRETWSDLEPDPRVPLVPPARPRRLIPPQQASQPRGQGLLHGRIAHARRGDAASASATARRVASSAPGPIAQAVLPELRDLDPGVDGDRSAASRQVEPRRDGLVVAAHPAQEARSLDPDALGRPRRIETAVHDPRPGRWSARACRRPRRAGDATTAVAGRPRDRRPPTPGHGSGSGGRSGSSAASRQPRASSRRRSRANARARPARSPRGAVRAGGRVRVVDVDPPEQPRQRANVLPVVADDLHQRLGWGSAEEVEEPARDLPALDVAVAMRAEQLDLDRPKPGVGHPMPEDPTDERQQVKVAGERRWGGTRHPVPRDEQRPVEAAAVVGHEPRVRGEVAARDARAARPPPDGPAAGAGPGGTARPPTSPSPTRNATVPEAVARPVVSVSRQTRGTSAGGRPGSPASRSRSIGRMTVAGSQRTTGPAGSRSSSPSTAAASRRPSSTEPLADAAVSSIARLAAGRREGGPVVREASLEGRAAHRPAATAASGSIAAPRPRVSCSSRRSASARASTSGSRRGPVHAGQPLSQSQPRMSSAAPAISSSCRSQSRGLRPIPPGTASYR